MSCYCLLVKIAIEGWWVPGSPQLCLYQQTTPSQSNNSCVKNHRIKVINVKEGWNSSLSYICVVYSWVWGLCLCWTCIIYSLGSRGSPYRVSCTKTEWLTDLLPTFTTQYGINWRMIFLGMNLELSWRLTPAVTGPTVCFKLLMNSCVRDLLTLAAALPAVKLTKLGTETMLKSSQ